MPAGEPSLRVDGRSPGGDQSHSQRQHREAMVGKTPPKGTNPRADVQQQQWDDAGWDQEHDEACRRAQRLLSGSDSRFYLLGDRARAFRRWPCRERWIRRLAVIIGSLLGIFAGCFGGLWWRLGAGPINLEMATPWLPPAPRERKGPPRTAVGGGGPKRPRGGR